MGGRRLLCAGGAPICCGEFELLWKRSGFDFCSRLGVYLTRTINLDRMQEV